MISVSAGSIKICMSSGAKATTPTEMAAQKQAVIRMPSLMPLRMRPALPAPAFWAIKVPNPLPKSVAGIMAKLSILPAAAKAAMTVTPKLFTSPCTSRMPKFITDCCRLVSTLLRPSRRSSAPSGRQSSRVGRRPGTVMSRIPRASTADPYWQSTVASAAPAVPRRRPTTNKRSSPTLPSAAATVMRSGAIELPTARSTAAPKLKAKAAGMPSRITRI